MQPEYYQVFTRTFFNKLADSRERRLSPEQANALAVIYFLYGLGTFVQVPLTIGIDRIVQALPDEFVVPVIGLGCLLANLVGMVSEYKTLRSPHGHSANFIPSHLFRLFGESKAAAMTAITLGTIESQKQIIFNPNYALFLLTKGHLGLMETLLAGFVVGNTISTAINHQILSGNFSKLTQSIADLMPDTPDHLPSDRNWSIQQLVQMQRT